MKPSPPAAVKLSVGLLCLLALLHLAASLFPGLPERLRFSTASLFLASLVYIGLALGLAVGNRWALFLTGLFGGFALLGGLGRGPIFFFVTLLAAAAVLVPLWPARAFFFSDSYEEDES